MRNKAFLPLILFLFLPFLIKAQCKEYIKSIAADVLDPYVLDGNFFAPVIYEGEEISLTRTFLAGQKYKIAVVGMDFFEKEITIKDQDGFIVFKNYRIKRKESDQYFTDYEGYQVDCMSSTYWEFQLEQSQNLTITVKLDQKAKRKKDRLRGCLGIVVGFYE
ncbi:MAG: hypothetical protein JXL97_08935 [Bacteroidales bacterium]|nr:hypothetical protein [Bacteroidales bacterium]